MVRKPDSRYDAVTPRRVRLRSLAKINLDLRVLHKNPNGFHELRTVFQSISLADTIEIEFEPARRTDLSIDDELHIPDNLILRAAKAVLDAAKTHARVRFRLTKRIPMGAGLGGGSSNAAAVLLALPVLAGKAVSLSKLTELGTELGSDVPFFLTGGTALGLGRGAELYTLPDIAEEPILVVAPGIHVATPGAYQALGRSLTFTGMSSSINNFQAFVRTLEQVRLARAASELSANDFETVVTRQYPQLKTIQGKLWGFGLRKQARMTGSGSAFFAIFPSKGERDRARGLLEGDRVFQGEGRVLPAALVNRANYVRLWRRQLTEHLVPVTFRRKTIDDLWPPRSCYIKNP
jgi:4-diphosphocytidyl-2-C-methyl-D-erythritol kinase